MYRQQAEYFKAQAKACEAYVDQIEQQKKTQPTGQSTEVQSNQSNPDQQQQSPKKSPSKKNKKKKNN